MGAMRGMNSRDPHPAGIRPPRRFAGRRWAAEVNAAALLLWPGWLVVAVPLVLYGFPSRGHDSIHHARWTVAFGEQLAAGEWYPRWLLETNHGCGSPSFFFYPPFGFWVSGLFLRLFGGESGVWRALGAASALALLASAFSARALLRRLVPEPRATLLAVLYMWGPFHLAITLFERAAYAEFWSYVWLPLILRGILDLRDGQRAGWLFAIAGLTGLFLTHLPTSVTFPLLVLLVVPWFGLRTLARTVAALAVAVILSAFYWLPCAALRPHVQTEAMDVGWHQTFFFPALDPLKPLAAADAFNIRMFIVFLAWVMVLGCCYALHLLRPAEGPRGRDGLVWLLGGLFLTGFLVPVTEWFYELFKPLRMIQFAWRFLTPATVWTVLLLAQFWPMHGAPRPVRWLHRMALGVSALAVAVLSWDTFPRVMEKYRLGPSRTRSELRTLHDAVEYRPRGTNPLAAADSYGTNRVASANPEIRATVLEWKARKVRLAVEAGQEGLLWVRQLWFPGWQASLDDGKEMPLGSEGPGGTISVRVPPGSYSLSLLLRPTAFEVAGCWISLLGLMSTCGVLVYSSVSRRRTRGEPNSGLSEGHPAADVPQFVPPGQPPGGKDPADCSSVASDRLIGDTGGDRCLAVLIPCYNESATVDAILEKVLLQPNVAEVIVVDDGSTDGTWQKLQSWPARDPRVRVYRQERNRGKGAAIRRALQEVSAEIVVIQDADLEYDPADWGPMVELIRSGRADVVYGSRFAPGACARTAWWHRGLNRLLTWAANRITGLVLTDEATCYKMFRREILFGLDLQEEGFGFCPEVTAKLARRGVRIMEMPIRYTARSRADGKKLRLKDGWEALRCLWRYTRR